MKLVIETNVASQPAWWLLDDDDRVVDWAGRTYPSLAYADQAAHDCRVNADDPFTSEAAARVGARRVQLQACTAIGP